MITRFGRIKVETEYIDLSYRLFTRKVGEKEVSVATIEFALKRPIQPGAETRDTAKLIKAFIKELVPSHDITVIVGRGPIWFYGVIQHEIQHSVKTLAFFDPKLSGAVIVAQHSYDLPLKEGEVIELPEDVVKELTQ